MLKEKISHKKRRNNKSELESMNKDELWDIIATSITKCTREYLLGKKITIGNSGTRQKKASDTIKKDLKILGNLCCQCTSEIGTQIRDTRKLSLNDQIDKLNSTYDLEIVEITETVWTKERLNNLKIWWKIMYEKV
jgi:hypothetical protein